MTQDTASVPQPLTVLAEDEQILRDSVRKFADAQVRPLVREMDEQAKFRKDLIAQLFELQRREALTMVIATHNLSFAQRCDRVYRIAGASLLAA